MRKGFDGLAALVRTTLSRHPFSGHLFVFCGRRGALVRLLWWDGDGLCLLAKRLERGRFVWPRTELSSSESPAPPVNSSKPIWGPLHLGCSGGLRHGEWPPRRRSRAEPVPTIRGRKQRAPTSASNAGAIEEVARIVAPIRSRCALATTRRWRLQLSRAYQMTSLKRPAGAAAPALCLTASSSAWIGDKRTRASSSARWRAASTRAGACT
jgi:hypothetical protein